MRAHSLNHYLEGSLCILTNTLAPKNSLGSSLAIIVLSLISFLSFSQPKSRVFDKQSGLSDNNTRSIAQDQHGQLWVGTENGLNRFDGNSFKIFKYSANDKNSIASNYISSLDVDNSNRIWIGHVTGVTRYDPFINEFTRYDFEANGITFIAHDNENNIWVGLVGKGLIIINPETAAIEKTIDLTPFINKNYSQREISRFNTINGVVHDPSGIAWLATQDGLYTYDRKLERLKPVRLVEDVPGKHRDDFLKSIVSDNNGGFWLASFRGGVCHYSPNRNSFMVYQTTERIYDSDKDLSFTNTVNAIGWKSPNELWLTTWDKDKAIGIFNTLTRTSSFIKSSDIFGKEIRSSVLLADALFVDRKGVAWITSSMGLIMIDPSNVLSIKILTPPFSGFSISDMVEDTINHKNFFATYYGPGLIVTNTTDSSTRSFQGQINPAEGDFEYIHDLMDTRGDSLWVISTDHVSLFDKVKEKWIEKPELQKLDAHTGEMSPSFYKIIEATSGDYWIATGRNGVYSLCASDLSFINFKRDKKYENSLCSNAIEGLVEDKFGRIWFASRNAGISILDPQTNSFLNLSNKKAGSLFLPTDRISDIDLDPDGNVWLATFEVGLIKINVIKKDSFNIVAFDNELLSGPSDEVKIDEKGRVWFRHSSGAGMLDPKTMVIKSFEDLSHLIDLDFAFLKSNNRILIGGTKGYGMIDEKNLRPDTSSNRVIINSVKVFGNEIYPVGENHNQIRLPYDQNSLTIDFTSVDFLHNQEIKYSYKLEGLRGNQWTVPSSNSFTEYTNLPGGDYIFKVKTANQEGIWSNERILLYIHIDTPFWKTNWFYALSALAGTALITLLYIYQVNRNKRMAQLQLKALHTQMRPHFIFNCLSAINSHIIKFETVKASEFLTQFSKLMRCILENSTESWITLEQEIATIKLYLVMEGLRFEDRFTYSIEVEEGIDPAAILIPSMILQPYVENAIAHGLLHKEHGTGMVSIKFLKGDGNLKCIIEDNGVGREISGKIKQRQRISRRSLGVQITSERLHLLRGGSAAEIEDLKNELGEATGTRIVIILMTKQVPSRDIASLN